MKNEPLLAWFGDPALKERVVLKMKEHRAKDEIIQGTYQDFVNDKGKLVWPEHEGEEVPNVRFQGCAIGCTLPPITHDKWTDEGFSWHREIEEQYGISAAVAWFIDEYFEAMPTFDEAAQFAVDVIEAIPVGADLSGFEYYNMPPYQQFLVDLRNAPVPGAIESI